MYKSERTVCKKDERDKDVLVKKVRVWDDAPANHETVRK